MSTLEILLIAGVAIGMASAAWAAIAIPVRRTALMDRLKRYEAAEEFSYEPKRKPQQVLWTRFLGPFFEGLGRRLQVKAGNSQLLDIAGQLEVAGNPGGLTAPGLLALMVVCGGVGAALGLLLGVTYVGDPTQTLLLVIAIGGGGLYAPKLWLSRRVKEQRLEILEGMPNAMDLLTLSVEAGLGFDAAMQRVSEKYSNSLAQEFGKVLQEMQLGRSRKEALMAMSERVQVDEIASFVTAIVQSSELGASLADTLRVQSEDMRRRRRQRAEEKGNQAPLKMLFPMVGCIFPSLFVVLLGPAVIQVAHQFAQK